MKGSRFLVAIAPAPDEATARELVDTLRAEFPDASHHCSAWRIADPTIDRSNDDGEPGGSAGRPILAQLVGRELVNTAVVVTRYFGGTKLGVGGLMRAYGGAAGVALDQMTFVPWVDTAEASFATDYSLVDTVERLVSQAGGEVRDRSFGTEVVHHVQLPVDQIAGFSKSIADITAGAVTVSVD